MSAPPSLLTRRASRRETSSSRLPSPHLTFLRPGAVLANDSLANFPWHNPHPYPSPHPHPPTFTPFWPPCPVENHTTCAHGGVYHYANTHPGRQQRLLLEQGGFGADFFEYGNPPPAVWAAVWRVMGGRIEKRDLDLVFEYRMNHCPRRRGEIVAGVEADEALVRGRMADLGIGEEGEWGGIDGVVRG